MPPRCGAGAPERASMCALEHGTRVKGRIGLPNERGQIARGPMHTTCSAPHVSGSQHGRLTVLVDHG
jgi:hypothetical protein